MRAIVQWGQFKFRARIGVDETLFMRGRNHKIWVWLAAEQRLWPLTWAYGRWDRLRSEQWREKESGEAMNSQTKRKRIRKEK